MTDLAIAAFAGWMDADEPGEALTMPADSRGAGCDFGLKVKTPPTAIAVRRIREKSRIFLVFKRHLPRCGNKKAHQPGKSWCAWRSLRRGRSKTKVRLSVPDIRQATKKAHHPAFTGFGTPREELYQEFENWQSSYKNANKILHPA